MIFSVTAARILNFGVQGYAQDPLGGTLHPPDSNERMRLAYLGNILSHNLGTGGQPSRKTGRLALSVARQSLPGQNPTERGMRKRNPFHQAGEQVGCRTPVARANSVLEHDMANH